MKKISVVLVLTFVLLTFSGCWAGETTGSMAINSEKGKGSKTITFTILKDHVKKPDNNGNVDDNSKYFPQGMGAVTTWLKSNVPADHKVEFSDKADSYVYSITYTFNDIAEYNAKTKALVGNASWSALKLTDATIAAVEKDGSYDVTFTENPKVLEGSIRWAIDGIFKNKQIFDPRAGIPSADPVTADIIFTINKLSVKVGSKTTAFDMKAKTDTVTALGSISKTAAATETPADTNPSTGDNITVYLVLGALALVGMVTMFTRKRSLN